MPTLVPNREFRILGSAELSFLKSLLRYRYLSSRQVCRLHFSSGSLTYVQSKLKRLTDDGFCQRIWVPKRVPHGSSPAVYTLARRGINQLRDEGLEVSQRYHPSEKQALSYLFLNHTLELNEFLICAELLCRWQPEFHLAALLHDSELKRRPVYVVDDDGRRAAVVPDAWLNLRIQGSFQVCLAVELDRGTEEQKKWRRKVSNLLRYANGPYQETFGTRSLTVAVVTTAGEKRLLELLAWTRAELEAKQEKSQDDLFLFTSASPETMNSESMFLLPRWYRVFSETPLALLENNWA
ncbi:MAG TPA: replication-relaxation family protein [Dehalococcoidia bacterium]|nr:replication-relaxation family protein [Dehalococcoidia bacterium]